MGKYFHDVGMLEFRGGKYPDFPEKSFDIDGLEPLRFRISKSPFFPIITLYGKNNCLTTPPKIAITLYPVF